MSQAVLSRPGIAKPPLATLVMLAAVSPLAINMFMPSMPSIADDLGAPYATIQLGLSLYLACMAVVQLVSGPISDRTGRRPVLIGALILFIIGSIICTLAPNAFLFLVGRIIQAASATGMVLSRAIVRDVYPREKAASMIGYVVMAMTIAPMVGPTLGGLVDGLAGWRASFGLMALFGLVTLFMTWSSLPETNTSQGQTLSAQLASWRAISRISAFWLYTAAASLASGIFFGFLGGAPAVSDVSLGQTPLQYGLWFAFCAIGYMGGNFLSGRFSQVRGVETMVRDGALACMIGAAIALGLFAAGFVHPASLFVPMTLVGIGNGMTLPNAIAAVISIRPEAAGAASGLLGATQIGIAAIASVIGAFAGMQGASPIGLCLFMFITAVIGWIAAILAARTANEDA